MCHRLLKQLLNDVAMVKVYNMNQCSFTAYCFTGGDIIFNTNQVFTLASGERLCFNVTVVDDNEIEYYEAYAFTIVALNRSLPFYQFYDRTRITIRDNEGQ